MAANFSIEGKEIGEGRSTFIVAEISGNHHKKYEEAAALVRVAKDAGADAVKLQTYTPATITLDADSDYFRVKGKDQPADWKGARLWDLYENAHTPWEWQPKLKKLADELGIILFSTPFDDTAVDFLEHQVDVACYKVASYEAIHIPLLRTIAKTGKPVIISIGYASVEEADLAIKTLRESGAGGIAILHCVTEYADAANLQHMNLETIRDIRKHYDTVAGFSDNNGGILAPIIAAVAFGASVVEKHIILARADGGPDARFSLEPDELKEMVRRIRLGEKEGIEAAIKGIGSMSDVEVAKGHVQYGPASPQEEENLIFRPSLWVKKAMRKGEEFTPENTCVRRPSNGLLPKYWDEVIGKRAAKDIEFATPISREIFES